MKRAMPTHIARYLSALAILLLAPMSYGAGVVYWNLNEVFSSADGTLQFVELTTRPVAPSESASLGAYVLANERGQEMFFQMPYAAGLGSDTFLLATPGFSTLPGSVPPDVSWLPSGFLSPSSGALHLQPYGAVGGTYGGMFDSGFLSWPQLNFNGTASFGPSGINLANSPENHAGQIGFIVVPEPSIVGLLALGLGLGYWRSMREPESVFRDPSHQRIGKV